jgi:fido (protein-threonine AMPylation protein)
MTPKPASFAIEEQPEVFFSTTETSSAVNYAVRVGKARQITRGIYTRNVDEPLESVVRRNCWRIAAYLAPGAVVVDRSAVEMAPAADGSLILAAKRARETLDVHGLQVRVRKGEPATGDQKWMGEDLFMSSRARAFLDNCRASRSRALVRRTLSRAELEEQLDTYASRDPTSLNRLRDEARALSLELDAEEEFETLDGIIGALQGTRETPLKSSRAAARSRGVPYDETRLVRFEQLAQHLLSVSPPKRGELDGDLSALAFFEAYFSNFIEGTEFTLDEAVGIVFGGKIPELRPKDAHDIIGTYKLISDTFDRRRTPQSDRDLVDFLRAQHRVLMAERPEVGPGEFKKRPNRAGGTEFVAPELVEGTLLESWRFYESLAPGFARAAFAMFAVSEVHPFADGNGRIARILMNSELTAAGEQRIIVPTSLRSDYLYGLRAMTHNALARNYVTVLSGLQAFTAGIDFTSRQSAELDLHRQRAFDDESAQPGALGEVIADSGGTPPEAEIR